MKNNKPLSKKTARILRAAEIISSMIVLALALNSTAWTSFEDSGYTVTGGMFLAMTVSAFTRLRLSDEK